MTESRLVTTSADVFSRVPFDVLYPIRGEDVDWGEDANSNEGEWEEDVDDTDWLGRPKELTWIGGYDSPAHLLRQQRERLELKASAGASFALIDWSAVNNVCRLFEDPEEIADPFIAVLDLAAVVGAIIFNDYVVCLDYAAVSSRTSEFLGLDGIVKGIDASGPDSFRTPSMRMLIERYFLEAQQEFERAAAHDEPWLRWLAANWQRMLPSVGFPAHDYDAFVGIHGEPYSMYENRGDPDLARNNVFERRGRSYRVRDGDFRRVILDSDRRSLFYEFLLEQLRQHWDPERTMSFRYLSTCMRAPMKLARAQWAEAQLSALKPSPEDWLAQEWARLNVSLSGTVTLPFWLGALLATSSSRDDIPEALWHLRESAKGFRARRAELEEKLFVGDIGEQERLRAALQGDASRLTEDVARRASVAIDVVSTPLTAMSPVPVGPKSIAAVVSAVSPGWFRERWLKLFQPQVWCLFDLGRQARRVTNVLPVAFERFELPRAHAEEPLQFLERFGEAVTPL